MASWSMTRSDGSPAQNGDVLVRRAGQWHYEPRRTSMSEALHNSDRGHHALDAINGYGTFGHRLHPARQAHELTDTELELVEQWASDLLGDLMHLGDMIPEASFDAWKDRAIRHYEEELLEEADEKNRIVDDQEIVEALKAKGLDVEYWNTGGGCMVTYAIIRRNGPVVHYGTVPDPDGKRQATEYIGVTCEDGQWIIWWIDQDLGLDGEEVELRHHISTGRAGIEEMAAHVHYLVTSQLHWSIKHWFKSTRKVEA